MQTKMWCKSRFLSSMQMLFTMMQMRNVHMMHMFPIRGAIFMMQMSLWDGANAKFIHDSASAHIELWCKCLLTEIEMQNLVVQMPSNGYVMTQMLLVGMSRCECPLVGMSWCKCTIVGMPWYKCTLRYVMNANVLLWVYHDMNALMQTHFIQKFPLFSKRGFLSTWNQNILKAWFIIPEKSSFLT